MIIEFKVANYRSIHEEQTISFVADAMSRLPDNLIKRDGYRLLKALALFGPNASGKSNLCRALWEMARLVADSAETMKPDYVTDAAQSFRLTPESRFVPSRFEITVLIEELVYRYGFAVSAQAIEEEWLYVSQENRETETTWFHRKSPQSTEETPWEFGSPLTQEASWLRERTRPKALLLSVAATFNVNLLRPLFFRLAGDMRVVDMASSPDFTLFPAAYQFLNDEAMQKRVLQFLNSVDIGLEDLQVTRKHPLEASNRQIGAISSPGFGPNLSPAMASVQQSFDLRAFRKDSVGERQSFNLLTEESIGTQRLFGLIILVFNALDTGAFFVVDELDASLHPLLTRRLLEAFQSPELNTKGAQLLFTTHDAILFDPVLFRRDQILLAEKRRGGSQFYSLADVEPPPRNADKFLRNYLSGRYGATPYLGLDYEFLVDKVTR